MTKKHWTTGGFYLGGILLLTGAITFITGWEPAPYLYCIGALLFATMQFITCYRGNDWLMKRLRNQQILGAILLVVTGILMFVTQHNEWIICLTIATIFEVYTIFRMPDNP